jgi:hypothetical protein
MRVLGAFIGGFIGWAAGVWGYFLVLSLFRKIEPGGIHIGAGLAGLVLATVGAIVGSRRKPMMRPISSHTGSRPWS